MNKGPNQLLTICIPTYNRANHLKNCLERVLAQAQIHQLPICISDNASSDNTAQVVEDFQKRYPFISYSRNEKNLGPDMNFEKVLKLSSTKYAWLLSDDDRMETGAIDRILPILDRENFDLVLVNGGKRALRADALTIGRVSDVPSAIYRDRNRLLADLGWHATWMSCLIFSSEMVKRGEFSKYHDSNFLQFAVIFDYLAAKEIAVFWEAQPLIYNSNYEIPAWYPKAFEIFGRRWIKAVSGLPEEYTKTTKDKCILDHGVKSRLFGRQYFLTLKFLGYFDYRIYQEYETVFGQITKLALPEIKLISLLPIPRFLSWFVRQIIGPLYQLKLRLS